MPLPDFTDDEQYLINSAKSTAATSQTNSYMWGYLIGGAVLAAFGAYHENVPMMLTAFVVVCGFRICEEPFQSGWLPLWRSIIAKYEAAALRSRTFFAPICLVNIKVFLIPLLTTVFTGGFRVSDKGGKWPGTILAFQSCNDTAHDIL